MRRLLRPNKPFNTPENASEEDKLLEFSVGFLRLIESIDETKRISSQITALIEKYLNFSVDDARFLGQSIVFRRTKEHFPAFCVTLNMQRDVESFADGVSADIGIRMSISPNEKNLELRIDLRRGCVTITKPSKNRCRSQDDQVICVGKIEPGFIHFYKRILRFLSYFIQKQEAGLE